MFAQHTIDVRSTRTELDRNRERLVEGATAAPRGPVGLTELIIPAQASSERIQTTGGGTTLIITNQIKCRITI